MRGIFQCEGRVALIPLPDSPPTASVVCMLMGEDVSSFHPKATTAASTSAQERRRSASSTKAVRVTSPDPSTISRKSRYPKNASMEARQRSPKSEKNAAHEPWVGPQHVRYLCDVRVQRGFCPVVATQFNRADLLWARASSFQHIRD